MNETAHQIGVDLRAAYQQELEPRRRSALLSWLAFTSTFGAVRGITYSIRAGRGPFHNLKLGGAPRAWT